MSQSWPTPKKIRATAIVGGCCFLSPFASTIFAPSIHLVMEDLGITDSTVGALQVSIFLFALALGPLFIAPLSEKYGRAAIIHFGNFFFVVFSLGGGFSQTAAQFSVCRLFAGFGGSAAIAVVGKIMTLRTTCETYTDLVPLPLQVVLSRMSGTSLPVRKHLDS
jgi:MFS family permease